MTIDRKALDRATADRKDARSRLPLENRKLKALEGIEDQLIEIAVLLGHIAASDAERAGVTDE